MTPSRALVSIPVRLQICRNGYYAWACAQSQQPRQTNLAGLFSQWEPRRSGDSRRVTQTRKEIYLPVPSGVKHGWIEPAPAATNIRRTKMAIKRVSVRRTTKTVKAPVKVTVRRTIKVTRTR